MSRPYYLLIKAALLASILALPAYASSESGSRESNCAETLNYNFKKLASDESVNLCSAYQGKVIIVVNTASKCGYTHQYEGLENIYDKYHDQGLVILGFPSNDFANQEPGDEDEIKEFCRRTYGVKFPMFEKSTITGQSANPLFIKLSEITGDHPRWNFHKYIINRSGEVVKSFPSAMDPDSPEITRTIKSLL